MIIAFNPEAENHVYTFKFLCVFLSHHLKVQQKKIEKAGSMYIMSISGLLKTRCSSDPHGRPPFVGELHKVLRRKIPWKGSVGIFENSYGVFLHVDTLQTNCVSSLFFCKSLNLSLRRFMESRYQV